MAAELQSVACLQTFNTDSYLVIDNEIKHVDDVDPWWWDARGIPVPLFFEALSGCEYGSHLDIGLELNFYTGSRLSEPGRWNKQGPRSNLQGNVIRWMPGKNQTGWRKEIIPPHLIRKLQYYWFNEKVPQNRIYGWTGENLSHQFNKQVRPKLSEAWQKTVLSKNGLDWEYDLQLKGLRKTFVTLVYQYYKNLYGADVASTLTSRRMLHSSTKITKYHYEIAASQLQAEKYVNLMPFQIKPDSVQLKLSDFGLRNPCLCINSHLLQ